MISVANLLVIFDKATILRIYKKKIPSVIVRSSIMYLSLPVLLLYS